MFKYREMDNDGMTVFEYGNPNAGIVLVQPVDDHDMSVMDSEVRYIRELTDQEFGLIAVKVRNWNRTMTCLPGWLLLLSGMKASAMVPPIHWQR